MSTMNYWRHVFLVEGVTNGRFVMEVKITYVAR